MCLEMAEYVSFKWQSEDGEWHLWLIEKHKVEEVRKRHTLREEDNFKARLGYLEFLWNKGIIKAP